MKPFYFSAVWLPAKKQTPVVGKGLGIDLNVLFYKGHGVKIKEVTPFPPSLPTNPPTGSIDTIPGQGSRISSSHLYRLYA